jgi:hypothetical protein
MWKPAAAAILMMAGATAHAQQQQSPIENLDKTISELAQEGYEIKAAEGLSGDIPKFVLQKTESIIICQSTFQLEKKTVSNLGRGAGKGLEINRKPSIHGKAGQMNQEKRDGGWIDAVVGVIIVAGSGAVRRAVRAQHASSVLLD